MLNAYDVTVRFGSRSILHGVSLSARPGTVTAIIGPNGSGKTTLLRRLTGEIAGEGSVTLNGFAVPEAGPGRLAAIRAVLPQASTLAFPFLAGEIVRMGAREGLGPGEAAAAERALQAVGLAGFGGRFYQDLSGGEQQRVHLARVMAQVGTPVGPDGPTWLFLDEPVANLDIAHQLVVMDLARRHADAGGGVVAVMHDLNLTAMFADLVILVAQGTILAAGHPDEILTDSRLSEAYGCTVRANRTPSRGAFVLPQTAEASV